MNEAHKDGIFGLVGAQVVKNTRGSTTPKIRSRPKAQLFHSPGTRMKFGSGILRVFISQA